MGWSPGQVLVLIALLSGLMVVATLLVRYPPVDARAAANARPGATIGLLFSHYYGDDFKVECPTGSGQCLTLKEIADELSHRLMRIFVRDDDGRRAVFGGQEYLQHDPHWRDYVLFYEYFHGDNSAGVGASHQTGWTGLIAKLIQQQGEHHAMPAIETVAATA